VPWVKQGILLAFRAGRIVRMPVADAAGAGAAFHFYDKHLLPTRDVTLGSGVRVVPGGSTIRRGAHVGAGVVCMPPSTPSWDHARRSARACT
jgi:2,3,4,5-tetrahydropyridine-2-carboxylate N-succinyltransferase